MYYAKKGAVPLFELCTLNESNIFREWDGNPNALWTSTKRKAPDPGCLAISTNEQTYAKGLLEPWGFKRMCSWKRYENSTVLNLWLYDMPREPLIEPIQTDMQRKDSQFLGCCGCYWDRKSTYYGEINSGKKPYSPRSYNFWNSGPWRLWITFPTDVFTIYQPSESPLGLQLPEPKEEKAA